MRGEGSLPKMWFGLLLLGIVVGVPAYLLLGVSAGDQEPDAEAVAACEGWEQLRADRQEGEVSPDEQVEQAQEIQALAEAADFHVSLFGVIATRLEQGMDLTVRADRADTVCEEPAGSASSS